MANKYISLEEALKIICEPCANYKGCTLGVEPVCKYFIRMNEIPAADVRPALRAYWEEVDNEVANLTHKCSHCENEAHLDEFGEELLTEYCPECGARMWEDEN